MFQSMIKQENLMRKTAQNAIREKLGIREDANIGGNLFLNSEDQIVDAINYTKNAQSVDLKVMNEHLSEALIEFRNMNKEASIPLYVQFDPQNIEQPQKQTYDMMVHVSSIGVLSSAMPITDLANFCNVLLLADSEAKYEDDVMV